MTRVYIAVFLLLMMAGCATTQEVRRLASSTEYSVSCWYFDWSICYSKANELCPGGHNFVSLEAPSGGKEMRFACPDAK